MSDHGMTTCPVCSAYIQVRLRCSHEDEALDLEAEIATLRARCERFKPALKEALEQRDEARARYAELEGLWSSADNAALIRDLRAQLAECVEDQVATFKEMVARGEQLATARREALEEAAKVVESSPLGTGLSKYWVLENAASRIRALAAPVPNNGPNTPAVMSAVPGAAPVSDGGGERE